MPLFEKEVQKKELFNAGNKRMVLAKHKHGRNACPTCGRPGRHASAGSQSSKHARMVNGIAEQIRFGSRVHSFDVSVPRMGFQ